MAAILRRVAHLRQYEAIPDTDLAAILNGTTWYTVCSAENTPELCTATNIVFPPVGFTSEYVSIDSMQAGGPWPFSWRASTYT